MAKITMRQMLEAGVHFGHQTRYWNPKMAPYIFGDRNKIHIINLEQTLPMFNDALNFAGKIAAKGGKVMFVGTKRAAQQAIRDEAVRCKMPFVDQRWLGGMLTNFKTIKQSVRRLHDIEKMEADGSINRGGKKEALMLTRELEKLMKGLGGIKDMRSLPDALFIVDVGHEGIAVQEAKTLGIPVIGIVDTNNSADNVEYIVPGNDDAIRAIQLYTSAIADAVVEGHLVAATNAEEMAAAAPAPKAPAKAATDKADAKPTAKVTKKAAPAKDAASADKAASAEKVAPAKEAPVAKEAAPAEEKPAEEKVAPAKKEAAPKAEKAVPAEKEEAVKKAPAKKVAEKKEPAKKAPAKKAASKSDADDLKKIEGIGPKIADTLNDAGVTTFAKLAGMDRDAIKAILYTVSTLKSKEPKTWPQQAQLAADGKWDELKVLQDELMGGI
ncbi:MAG TPA: 30S ribosomal protein S2 [Leucothrix sp.]|nr:30S ribosomal protein S2 [Leucothrix sp.]